MYLILLSTELDAEIETLPTSALARKILRHDSIAKKMVYGSHGDREEDVVGML